MKKKTYRGEIHCTSKENIKISFYGSTWENKKKAVKELKTMKKSLEEKQFIYRYTSIEIKTSKIIKI